MKPTVFSKLAEGVFLGGANSEIKEIVDDLRGEKQASEPSDWATFPQRVVKLTPVTPMDPLIPSSGNSSFVPPEGYVLPVLLAGEYTGHLVNTPWASGEAIVQVRLSDLDGHDSNGRLIGSGNLQSSSGGADRGGDEAVGTDA